MVVTPINLDTRRPKRSSRYKPEKGSKRYYVIEAMKGKGKTAEEILERAVALAHEDGRNYSLEDFRAVNVNFLAKYLRRKGYSVQYRLDTVRIS